MTHRSSVVVENAFKTALESDLPSSADLQNAKRVLAIERSRSVKQIVALPLRQRLGRIRTLLKAEHVVYQEKLIRERTEHELLNYKTSSARTSNASSYKAEIVKVGNDENLKIKDGSGDSFVIVKEEFVISNFPALVA